MGRVIHGARRAALRSGLGAVVAVLLSRIRGATECECECECGGCAVRRARAEGKGRAPSAAGHGSWLWSRVESRVAPVAQFSGGMKLYRPAAPPERTSICSTEVRFDFDSSSGPRSRLAQGSRVESRL